LTAVAGIVERFGAPCFHAEAITSSVALIASPMVIGSGMRRIAFTSAKSNRRTFASYMAQCVRHFWDVAQGFLYLSI
jgi:hypothetical protein